jgi:TolB-like protein
MSFFEELKRRHVFRVGIAYAIAGWLLIQVADVASESFGAPDWVMKFLITVVLLGFVVALVLAWAFELTPDGVKKAADVEGRRPARSAWRLEHIIIALLVVALSWLVYRQDPLPPADEAAAPISSRASGAGATTESASGPPAHSIPAPEAGASIAVLPFINMSDDPSQEYFSDGISEELLNVLSGVPGLRVSSRTSSFAFKGVNRNIREIAAILGVNHILEGSVRKAGEQVRITAQLIDTEKDEHIWSDTFDRRLDDIFAIQDEISSAIVQALREVLDMPESEMVNSRPATSNLDAFDLYLRAAGLQSVLSIETFHARVELLQQAVEADPGFGRAWVELAEALVSLPTWDHSLDMGEYAAKARRAAQEALAIDENDALAHLALAVVEVTEHDWPAWEQRLEKARELAAGKQAEELKVWTVAAEEWLGLGHLTRALEYADSGLRLRADDSFLHLIKGMALLDLGRREEALVHVEQAVLLGYAGGAGDQLWEYADQAHQQAIWTAATARYFQDHDHDLLHLLPQLKRVMFASDAEIELERRRFWQASREFGLSREDFLMPGPLWGYRLSADVLAALGEHETVADEYWGNSPFFWMWSPGLKRFRQSEEFNSRVRDSGMLDFWRVAGWPDLCRPLRDDDFECE